MDQNSRKPASIKPEKPYDDFPLFPHGNKQWAKKIRGKLHYFGPWADWESALQKFTDERDDLYAGRVPRSKAPGEMCVKEMGNRFLHSKRLLLDTHGITQRTYEDYEKTVTNIFNLLGRERVVLDLRIAEFEAMRAELAKRLGPVALGNEIQRIRVVFKYAYDADLIEKPIKFGPTFKKPSRKLLKQARNAKGKKILTPAGIHKLLGLASVQLKAMIYLGLNCGFGNHDCGMLPRSAIKRGWIDFPRPKTANERRIPLWPETMKALAAVAKSRPKPTDASDAGMVFITKYGQRWSKEGRDNPVSKEFAKLLKDAKLYRKGLGFYVLRHCFETVGGESKDQVAVDAIMGHADASMGATYREEVSDKRLKAVTETVRKWLGKGKRIT